MSELRRAVQADAEAIAGVDVRAWWHAYRSFLDEQRLAERSTEARTESWSRQLPRVEEETWVLEVGGRVAGFASLAPSRDADADDGTGELRALYVDPPAQGAGVGTRLLGHVQLRLGELGYEAATLWTFEANGLARVFYEQHGWVLASAAVGNKACEEWAPAVRYGRELGVR